MCRDALWPMTVKGWFTLATEATEAESYVESELKESSDLVWIASLSFVNIQDG